MNEFRWLAVILVGENIILWLIAMNFDKLATVFGYSHNLGMGLAQIWGSIIFGIITIGAAILAVIGMICFNNWK